MRALRYETVLVLLAALPALAVLGLVLGIAGRTAPSSAVHLLPLVEQGATRTEPGRQVRAWLLAPLRRVPRPEPAAREADGAGARAPPAPLAGLEAAEPSREAARSGDALPLRPPLEPVVIASGFGPRTSPFTGRPSRHEGIDLVAAAGSIVRASGHGTVRRAQRDGPFGLLVELDHGGGLTTRYAHLARTFVRVGQRVPAGAAIGLVGNTGRSTGPHLHYEVRVAGAAQDPARWLVAGRLVATLAEPAAALPIDVADYRAYVPRALGGEAETVP
ncbi:MAG: M23 family metallopeptidase [Geminicoccaceae bacterium]|nr:M23 family metallopeptidase [Geminicoccaceae bacterium]